MKKFYSIKFNLNDISDNARRMLEIADSQQHWSGYHPKPNGDVAIDVIDYDGLGSDDTFSIRVRDNLTWRERAETFGMEALEYRHMRKNENGAPITVSPNHFLPTEEYIQNVERAYEGMTDHKERRWSLREASEQLFGRVKGDRIAGVEAINAMASEFWQWCKDGEFSPVLPRGRSGGRNPIMDKPAKRRQITATDEVWQWLKECGGDNASEGLRRLHTENT